MVPVRQTPQVCRQQKVSVSLHTGVLAQCSTVDHVKVGPPTEVGLSLSLAWIHRYMYFYCQYPGTRYVDTHRINTAVYGKSSQSIIASHPLEQSVLNLQVLTPRVNECLELWF